MKISSRSILSPGRAGYSRESPPPITLSTSLSRRLSNSRSIKGGASPAMFPVTGKKRGCGFDNPEPSSPKVTCIGQVRVKTKKKKHPNNIRSLSKRRSSAGDIRFNFRKLEHSRSQSQHLTCLQEQKSNNNVNNNNNQRWVHIPLTICEALREVSCLFPCRSSCYETTSLENEEKIDVENSRRHVFDTLENEEKMDVVNSRKHVFDKLEIVDDVILGGKDEARVSVCVPPKNALLLMRCRSDPVKMEALTNRFWVPCLDIKEEEDEEKFDDCEDKVEENNNIQEFVRMEDDEKIDDCEDKMEENKIFQEFVKMEDEKVMGFDDCLQKFETCEDIEEINSELEMKEIIQEKRIETNEEEEDDDDESFCIGCLFEENGVEFEEDVDSDMEDAQENLFDDEDVQETETGESNVEKIKDFEEENEGRKKSMEALPQCLLLMMYEPKLSMEVSKETWVCRSDFIQRHSGPRPLPDESIDNQDELKVIDSAKEHENHEMTMTPDESESIYSQDESKVTDSAKEHDKHEMTITAVQHQSARSSCSILTPHSVIAMVEQNLVNTMGFEPLVLSRCKSAPVRTPPETCYWTNKVEPSRRASFGVDMVGLGMC